MRTLFALCFLFVFTTLNAQVFQYLDQDKQVLGIRDKFGEEEYQAKFVVTVNKLVYEAEITVEADEWGEVDFPADFIAQSDEPDPMGVFWSTVKVIVNGETAYEVDRMLTFQPERTLTTFPYKGLKSLFDIQGKPVDNEVNFWLDTEGYNYVIRANDGDGPGIFAYHYRMNANGNVTLVNKIEKEQVCPENTEQEQHHGKSIKIFDANKDGAMEAYFLWVDECIEAYEPMYCKLIVFTKKEMFEVDGYSIVKGESTHPEKPSGFYKYPVELNVYPKIKDLAGTLYKQFVPEVSK